ncbi:MAG: phosphohydrolase, partial [Dinghuibacter sp.]|nr:phosphohydrolase [Dinghuibacter sp.]
NRFLQGNPLQEKSTEWLQNFCYLDDQDVLMSVKTWMNHPDPVLRMMCTMLTNRNLYRVSFVPNREQENLVQQKRAEACQLWGIAEKDAHYLAFDGIAENSTYKVNDEQIHILFKDGTVKQISEVENALVHQSVAAPVRKYYICSVRTPAPR